MLLKKLLSNFTHNNKYKLTLRKKTRYIDGDENTMRKIVLFDGTCHFCNRSVQFIIKRDPSAHFSFASLQSEIGSKLLKKHNVPNDIDTIVLIDDRKAYVQSSAVLRICKNLRGLWKLFYLGLIVPKPVRNFVYNSIANNRYKWFGTANSCALPTPEQSKRFLT